MIEKILLAIMSAVLVASESSASTVTLTATGTVFTASVNAPVSIGEQSVLTIIYDTSIPGTVPGPNGTNYTASLISATAVTGTEIASAPNARRLSVQDDRLGSDRFRFIGDGQDYISVSILSPFGDTFWWFNEDLPTTFSDSFNFAAATTFNVVPNDRPASASGYAVRIESVTIAPIPLPNGLSLSLTGIALLASLGLFRKKSDVDTLVSGLSA